MKQGGDKRRVALIVPNIAAGGGVPSVSRFLYRVLEASGRYAPTVVSLPMSSHDEASVRLVRPATWLRGPLLTQGVWEGLPFVEVGAVGVELEVLRYRPRRALTDLLDTFDLVQVVSGTPAWANVTAHVRRPVLLQAASLIRVERASVLREARGVRGLWRRGMAKLVDGLDRSALRHVRTAFVSNAWMLDLLTSWMPPGAVRLAPPGIDTTRLRPADPRPADAPAADRYILSVGRFSDVRKNVRLLFRAYARLRERVAEAPRLVLAGSSGPSEADWAFAREAGIRDHVEFREGVSEEELATLYRDAAVFALASDEEGFGMVLVEAMASGVPVVSTACGGPQLIIDEGVTGYLTPPGDAEALAARMADLVGDEAARRRMGAAARAHAEARFSLEAAGRAFLAAYDEALGVPSPERAP